MAGEAKAVFETHADVARVETATTDGTLVTIENGKPFATSDPALISALDAHPKVKRAEAKQTKGADS